MEGVEFSFPLVVQLGWKCKIWHFRSYLGSHQLFYPCFSCFLILGMQAFHPYQEETLSLSLSQTQPGPTLVHAPFSTSLLFPSSFVDPLHFLSCSRACTLYLQLLVNVGLIFVIPILCRLDHFLNFDSRAIHCLDVEFPVSFLSLFVLKRVGKLTYLNLISSDSFVYISNRWNHGRIIKIVLS